MTAAVLFAPAGPSMPYTYPEGFAGYRLLERRCAIGPLQVLSAALMETLSTRAQLPESQLGKKATFEKAAHQLQQLAEQEGDWATCEGALKAAKRCMSLLRARHTNPACWSAGADFLEVSIACAAFYQTPCTSSAEANSVPQALVAADSTQQQPILREWLNECRAAADQQQSTAPPAAPSSSDGHFFEGQLSRVSLASVMQYALRQVLQHGVQGSWVCMALLWAPDAAGCECGTAWWRQQSCLALAAAQPAVPSAP